MNSPRRPRTLLGAISFPVVSKRMTQDGAREDIILLRPCPALFEMNQMLLTTRSRAVTQIYRDKARQLEENRAAVKRQSSPHNPLSAVLEDGAWQGQPAFLIGGGPSLIGFDFERLRGKGIIVAINRAFEFIPFADILFFMDWKFYRMCHDDPARYRLWEQFAGRKVFLNLMGRKLDDCFSVRSLGRNGLSSSLAKGLYHGNNSGAGALNLAWCMGAKPIYLLGYDMNGSIDGKSHFHSGYGKQPKSNVSKSFIAYFVEMAKRMGGTNRVINLNPKSGLRSFPFGNVDEVLDGLPRQNLGDNPPPVQEPVLLGASATD